MWSRNKEHNSQHFLNNNAELRPRFTVPFLFSTEIFCKTRRYTLIIRLSISFIVFNIYSFPLTSGAEDDHRFQDEFQRHN